MSGTARYSGHVPDYWQGRCGMKKVIACIASAAIAFSMTAVAPAAPQKAQAAAKSMAISSIQLSVNSGEKPGPDDEQEMGDAVLVKSGGKFLLMDTGAEYVSNSVVSYLKNADVKELDVYVSHIHPDHAYGLDAICENFKVNTVYLPDRSLAKDWTSESGASQSSVYSIILRKCSSTTSSNGPTIKYLKKGSTFSFGDVSAQVLGPVGSYSTSQKWKHPAIGEKSGHYVNNYSLTTMLTCGSTKFLTTGDIEEEEETALVKAYGSKLKADILKMPHHGLDSSNTAAFLAKVKPTWSFAENMGYEDSQKTSTKGETYLVSKNYQALQRYHEIGFAYLVGSEGSSLIIDVANNNVKLYRDKNKDAKAASGEQLKGKVTVKGDGLVTGSKAGYYGNNVYYLDTKTSKPATGVKKASGKWYCFMPGGAAEQGSLKKSGSKYVFNNYRKYNSKGKKDPKGKKLRSFKTDNSMAVGPTKIDGKWFLFDEKGFRSAPSKTAKGSKFAIVEFDGKYYAVNKNGFIYNYKGKSSAKLRMAGKVVTIDKKGVIKDAKVKQVKGVKAKNVKKRKVKVTWKKVKGAKGYYVLRATSKKGTYKKIKTIKKAKTVKFTDKKVKKKKTYYYKVQAYKKLAGFKVKGKVSKAKKVKVKK